MPVPSAPPLSELSNEASLPFLEGIGDRAGGPMFKEVLERRRPGSGVLYPQCSHHYKQLDAALNNEKEAVAKAWEVIQNAVPTCTICGHKGEVDERDDGTMHCQSCSAKMHPDEVYDQLVASLRSEVDKVPAHLLDEVLQAMSPFLSQHRIRVHDLLDGTTPCKEAEEQTSLKDYTFILVHSDGLPVEVICYILRFLPASLLPSLRLVSHNFNTVISKFADIPQKVLCGEREGMAHAQLPYICNGVAVALATPFALPFLALAVPKSIGEATLKLVHSKIPDEIARVIVQSFKNPMLSVPCAAVTTASLATELAVQSIAHFIRNAPGCLVSGFIAARSVSENFFAIPLLSLSRLLVAARKAPGDMAAYFTSEDWKNTLQRELVPTGPHGQWLQEHSIGILGTGCYERALTERWMLIEEVSPPTSSFVVDPEPTVVHLPALWATRDGPFLSDLRPYRFSPLWKEVYATTRGQHRMVSVLEWRLPAFRGSYKVATCFAAPHGKRDFEVAVADTYEEAVEKAELLMQSMSRRLRTPVRLIDVYHNLQNLEYWVKKANFHSNGLASTCVM
eukprot:Sspe_Gene.107601::Locus_85852_Transcript_1_1_Confidence_1.000_Length_1867::g.107601::m.107601